MVLLYNIRDENGTWTNTLFSLDRIAVSKNGSKVGTVNINFVCAVESGDRWVEAMGVGGARLPGRARLAGLGAEFDPTVVNIPKSAPGRGQDQA